MKIKCPTRLTRPTRPTGKARSFATCRLQVGRVGRVRRVGQWILEIGSESFAQNLATPSPRSFARDLASWEGQRPRCPYGGESGSEDAAPPGRLWRKQSNRQGALLIEFLMRSSRHLSCAKLSGISFLKIKCPTRLTRPTRPTPKANCREQSAYKINRRHRPQLPVSLGAGRGRSKLRPPRFLTTNIRT